MPVDYSLCMMIDYYHYYRARYDNFMGCMMMTIIYIVWMMMMVMMMIISYHYYLAR